MIGRHQVVVYPDRNANGWGLPLASNPHLTGNAAGWTSGPFEPALVWVNGGVRLPDGGGSMIRDRNIAGIGRRPDAVTYRVRAVVTIGRIDAPEGTDATVAVFVRLHFGDTAETAAIGPFWAGDEHADQQWDARNVRAGTSTIEGQWTVPTSWRPTLDNVAPVVAVTGFGATPLGVRVESLELNYRSNAASADVSCLVDEVTIHHGRTDTEAQPEPSSATIELTVTPDDPLPELVDVGAVLIVSTVLDGADDGGAVSSVRFVGRITDLVLGWDEAGERTPETGIGQLTAISMMADLGRRIVGDQPWAQELDGARVARILDLAGSPVDPFLSDPGTVQILGRDVDAQPALALAQEVAEDAGGMVWETRDGDVRYSDAQHRRRIPVSLELDACDVLVTPSWRRNTEGLLNDVSIGYGPVPEGSEQPRYAETNAASVNRWGRYAESLSTQLAALADARAQARVLLARHATPVWLVNSLPLDVAGLDRTDTLALLALDVHSLIRLVGMPTIGNAPTSVAAWVEGWSERLSFGRHDFEVIVSDYCHTAPPPTWDDVDPAWTWDTGHAGVTWDGATCLGPPLDFGRWVDPPASFRWDQSPEPIGWDDWIVTPQPVEIGG